MAEVEKMFWKMGGKKQISKRVRVSDRTNCFSKIMLSLELCMNHV